MLKFKFMFFLQLQFEDCMVGNGDRTAGQEIAWLMTECVGDTSEHSEFTMGTRDTQRVTPDHPLVVHVD